MRCRHRNFPGWRIATKVDAWVKLFVTIAYVWNQRLDASSSWVGEDCHYFSWPKSVAQNSMINFQWKRFVRVGFNAAAQIDLNGRLLSSYDALGIGIQTPALADCSKLSNTCELERWDDSNLIQFQQKSQINMQLGFNTTLEGRTYPRWKHIYFLRKSNRLNLASVLPPKTWWISLQTNCNSDIKLINWGAIDGNLRLGS